MHFGSSSHIVGTSISQIWGLRVFPPGCGLFVSPFHRATLSFGGAPLISAPAHGEFSREVKQTTAQTEPQEILPYFLPKSVIVFHLTCKSAPQVELVLPQVRGPGGGPRLPPALFHRSAAFCALARTRPVFACDHLWAPRSGPARSWAGRRGGRHPAGLWVTSSRLSLFFSIICMITWVSANDVQTANYSLRRAT